MTRKFIRSFALAFVSGLALAGCVATNGSGPPGTSAEGWKQIAQGAGQVIGKTKYDAKLAAEADKLYQYCGVMRPVATGATIFSPEKVQKAAQIAQATITTICDDKPRSVREALITAAAAWAEIAVLLAAPRPAPS